MEKEPNNICDAVKYLNATINNQKAFSAYKTSARQVTFETALSEFPEPSSIRHIAKTEDKLNPTIDKLVQTNSNLVESIQQLTLAVTRGLRGIEASKSPTREAPTNYSRNNDSPRRYNSNYTPPGSPRKCFYCDLPGHFARECPKKKTTGSPVRSPTHSQNYNSQQSSPSVNCKELN
jgi:hypothetical protein